MSQIHVTLTWVWSPWSIFSRSSGDLLQLCLQLRSLFQRALELRRGHRGCFTIRRLDSQSAARCPTTQCTTKRGNPWKLPYIFPTLNWFDPPKKWIIYSTDPWYTAVSWKLHWPTDLPLIVCDTSCLIFDVHRQMSQPPAEITRETLPSLASSVASWMSVSLAEGQSFRNRPSSIRREYLTDESPRDGWL